MKVSRASKGSKPPATPASATRSATPTPRRALRPHIWRLLAIAGLVAAAYSNSFQAGLIFDNAPVILQDPRVHQATAHNAGEILSGDYWYTRAVSGLYRPLTTFTYLLNYAVLGNGPRPAGYHGINLALHLANVTLVYALGLLIFGEIDLACALAALWGVHPLLTEAVTNIVGRADLLMALGVLTGLLCYIRGGAASGRARLAWLAGLVAAQTVGLFAKESAVVLPALMLLYDLTLARPASWRRRISAYAVLALPFALFLFLRGNAHTHLEISFLENPLIGAGFWTARLTAVKVIGKLAWLFLWPLHLSADYSYNAVPLFAWRLDGEDAMALLALAFCVTAAVLVVRWRRTHPAVSFFIGFFFVAIAPTANLATLIGSIMAERFLYLGSIGLAGCAVGALWWLAQRGLRPKYILWAATAVVCVLFGVRTYARNLDWHDAESLWTSTIRIVPDAARPHNNLGNVLMDEGRLPEAIAQFETAIRILPGSPDAHFNLGIALMATPSQLSRAISEYQAAIQAEPGYLKAHIRLGVALAQIPGRVPEAIRELQTAIRLQPDSAEAHNALGAILEHQAGRAADAEAEYRAAVLDDPAFADAHYNLGLALAKMPGRAAEALAELQTAVSLKPESAEMHYNLATFLAQMPGRFPEAIDEFRAAVRANPNFAPAHNNLGSALSRVPGQTAEAIAEYRTALRLQPDFPDAHYNLGVALAQQPGQRAEARTELETALKLDHNPETQRALDWLRSLPKEP